ncbi:hypothetical protein, partial [Klebsiella pneumoniae]|uniref:hypothetical protein n=1 Tax=Klebsiella pneumoniae TaxID=573 RepID=UPI0019549F9C
MKTVTSGLLMLATLSVPALAATTALPPAVAAAARASVRYLKHSGAERAAHQRQATRTRAALDAAGLPVLH